jgi:hypothetical protein
LLDGWESPRLSAAAPEIADRYKPLAYRIRSGRLTARLLLYLAPRNSDLYFKDRLLARTFVAGLSRKSFTAKLEQLFLATH